MKLNGNRFSLLATDLDGTLLDSQKRISPESMAALCAASGQGVEIVPATGRLYAGLPESIRALPFVRYAITVNGGVVYDAAERRVLRSVEIAPETGAALLAFAKGEDCLWECFLDGCALMDSRDYARIGSVVPEKAVAEMLLRLRRGADGLAGRLEAAERPLQKFQLFFRNSAARDDCLSRMSGRFPDLELTTSYSFNIEVNAAGADKGSALTFLCAHLGIPVSASVAFGDGDNDVPMLRSAGLGVAMGNAPDRVKAAAGYVAGGCDEGGFAAAVRALVLRP